MKITRLSRTNFKGLADGDITADGQDVIISGQNGAGKSSVAEIVPFVLFGKITGSIKRYENGLAPTDDNLIHGAEIEFDDGTTLRREYFWTPQGNRQNLYVNGEPVKLSNFKMHVELLTGGGGELVLNPFAFCNLPAKEQRARLVKLFGMTDERKILAAPEFANVATVLDGMPAEAFIAQTKLELRAASNEVKQIPVRLEELTRREILQPTDAQAALCKLESELQAARSERQTLTAERQPDFNFQLALTSKRLGDIERQKNFVTGNLGAAIKRRDSLRREYAQVNASKPGTCPTCGQKIPTEQFNRKRAEKLSTIVADGKRAAAEVAELEQNLRELDAETADLKREADDLRRQSQTQSPDTRREQLAALDKRIDELERRRAELRLTANTCERVDALRAREVELNKRIARMEGNIALVEQFLQRKIEIIEDEIGAHFEHVKFKLFDCLITTGEIRPTCEATLNGVPYSALSKGERLKAALDIFRTLQSLFGVELPLIIDDAESYTQNSWVDLPNQKFFFRVTDEPELSITISKARRAA